MNAGVNAALAPRHWLAYGALGLPLAMAALPVYVHVPRFYAESVGIDLALLGAVLLAARLLDAGLDPLIGWWGDRRRARRGMILLALPCLALGMLALLHPPAAHALPWLAGALALTYFGYSLATIALQAWGAELGRDARERTLLTASREGFGLIGVVVAAVLPGLLAADAATGLSRLAWVFVAVLAVLAGLTLLGAPRPPLVEARAQDAAPPLAVLGDAAFRRLLAVYLASGIAAALPATLVLFFVADVLQAEAWGGAFLALYFVAGAAGLPAWVMLARRIGRVRAWIAGMALSSLAFVWAYALGAGDITAFAAICLLSGLALGADLAFPPALLADLAERERASVRAGGYFGWWGLATKLNLALAAGISLPLLAWLGYRPGEEAGGAAALAAVYCLLPVGFKLVSAALAWRWRHTLEESP